ncbi:hypothetical protein DSECCO2_556900 [anaerobic digester metagenome]
MDQRHHALVPADHLHVVRLVAKRPERGRIVRITGEIALPLVPEDLNDKSRLGTALRIVLHEPEPVPVRYPVCLPVLRERLFCVFWLVIRREWVLPCPFVVHATVLCYIPRDESIRDTAADVAPSRYRVVQVDPDPAGHGKEDLSRVRIDRGRDLIPGACAGRSHPGEPVGVSGSRGVPENLELIPGKDVQPDGLPQGFAHDQRGERPPAPKRRPVPPAAGRGVCLERKKGHRAAGRTYAFDRPPLQKVIGVQFQRLFPGHLHEQPVHGTLGTFFEVVVLHEPRAFAIKVECMRVGCKSSLQFVGRRRSLEPPSPVPVVAGRNSRLCKADEELDECPVKVGAGCIQPDRGLGSPGDLLGSDSFSRSVPSHDGYPWIINEIDHVSSPALSDRPMPANRVVPSHAAGRDGYDNDNGSFIIQYLILFHLALHKVFSALKG